jgi:Domain of unknown function (DUF4214)/Protein of unknown function (DUF1524)
MNERPPFLEPWPVRSRRITLLSVLASLLVALGVMTPAAAQTTTVAELLRAVPVAPENTSAYSRDNFQHWIDADGDGCDTRAEVLIVESTLVTGGGCPVRTGQWESYFDGVVWTNASDLDVDHMVALSEAWDSGAHAWTAAQRRDFANDLTWSASLVAVTDNVNQSKGDRDPAEWLPPSAVSHCRYVTDWVSVKYRWNLSVDAAEETAIEGLLGGQCAGVTVQVPPRASTANTAEIQAYVTQVYNDLFGRNPDPVGLANWTLKLQQGTPYGAVANGITYSREFRSRLIGESYQHYLNRAPDGPGLQNWLNQMDRGMHIEQMQAGFIASPEFYRKAGGTDRQWIAALYRAVLDREPAASEVDSWQQRLNNGTSRQQAALGFLYSWEHLTDVVDSYYVELLRRNIDPTGRATWVSKIQGGARDEQIIANIVASTEYRQKAGSYPEAPVDEGPAEVTLGTPVFPSCVTGQALADKSYISQIQYPDTEGVQYQPIGDGDGDGTSEDAENNWVAISAVPLDGYVLTAGSDWVIQADGTARTRIDYTRCP